MRYGIFGLVFTVACGPAFSVAEPLQDEIVGGGFGDAAELAQVQADAGATVYPGDSGSESGRPDTGARAGDGGEDSDDGESTEVEAASPTDAGNTVPEGSVSDGAVCAKMLYNLCL